MAIKAGKRQREEDADSVESSGSEDERERMLALLDAQCRAMTGFSVEQPAIEDQEDEQDSQDDDEEDGDNRLADQDSDSNDDEWTGIDNPAPSAAVVIYDGSGQSTSKRTLEDVALQERDSFMSSKIRHIPKEDNKKGKGRARDTEEAAEEAHLASLDASLLSLIKDLPSDPSTSNKAGYKSSQISTLLPKLSSLPNPRYTVRKEREAPIDPRAPRQLRESLYSVRLGRAKTRAEHEKESGIVSAGSGGYALTKKKRREQTGAEDARRKKAKGLGGVVGKMRKGGSVLTLSKEEVRRGNEGDFEGLTKRKRKGAPKGLGGSGSAKKRR